MNMKSRKGKKIKPYDLNMKYITAFSARSLCAPLTQDILFTQNKPMDEFFDENIGVDSKKV